jgi:Ca-activated chloride channel family protein
MRRAAVFVTVVLATFVISAFAQNLVVDVNLTMLDVVVEDQNGRPVFDLTADDFEILQDGQSWPVQHFAIKREPISLGFLLDRSSSIAAHRKELDRTAMQLLYALRPDDEAFLITFAGRHKLNVRFTTDRNNIFQAIQKEKVSYGSRFYDAVFDSFEYLTAGHRPRKALVIFSDGADHYSNHRFGDMVEIAKLYGYPIFVFSYASDDSRAWSEEGRLELQTQLVELSRTTGGQFLSVSSTTDCARVVKDIVETVSQSYQLGFYNATPFENSLPPQVHTRDKSLRVRIVPTQLPL